MDTKLLAFLRAIAAGDDRLIGAQLAADPMLATQSIRVGATRQQAKTYFIEDAGHYVYVGDTALHFAAAVYATGIATKLIKAGADARARNRRGAEPLHYAADGNPESPRWNPAAQAKVIDILIAAGADPNAIDKSGVAPLHRAVRTRCAGAVRALIAGGADPRQKNGNGSRPLDLARRNTGRGGSGLPSAKEQQQEIIELLS